MIKLTKIGAVGLILIILFFSLDGRGCPKRSRNRVGSSSNEWAGIAAPSNLIATPVSSSQINLSWQDNSNNEDGFEIERKMWVSGTWQPIITVGANIVSYSNMDLVPVTEYYYRVRAFNIIGDRSDWSNEANATTQSLVWTNIAVGEAHNIGRTNDGRIWVWGLNDFFQLGLNDTYNRSVPTPQGTDTDWSYVATGSDHSICIKTNRTLWAWGSNSGGELGLGDTFDSSMPIQVNYDTDWLLIEGGGQTFYDPQGTTLAIKNNRTLWAWGWNSFGQLGLGDSVSRYTPTQVSSDSDWYLISVGSYHSLALKTNGTIWSWGAYMGSQLGLGIDPGDTTYPRQVGTDSDWSMVNAGGIHSLALKNSGTIYSCGNNAYGQLGLGDTSTRSTLTQIGSDSDWLIASAGNCHTVALKTNLTIWAWGHNEYGHLGVGDTMNRDTPTQLGTDADWSLVAAGGVGIAEVGGGLVNGHHTIAIKTNGSLWAWGYNRYGQLGIGTNTDVLTPTQTGIFLPNSPVSLVATVISSSQINLSWIDLSYNESRFEIERSIATNTNYTLLATVGADIILYNDTPISPNTVYYYRVRAYNPLGYSAYSNEAVAIAGDWTQIAAGYNQTFGIKTNGTIWSWGWNKYGQLGLGDSGNTTSRRTPTQIGTGLDWVSVAAGGDGSSGHTIARKSNGTLWSWGNNAYGQLGLGDSINRLTPAQIGNNSDWSDVAVGDYHVIAIKQSKTLWGWGNNYEGELGLGGADERWTPAQISSETNWSRIAAGSYHTIAIKDNKSVWAWGYNYFGQLGLGDSGAGYERYTPTQIGIDSDWYWIAAGQSHTLASKTDGTLWSWGRDDKCQLGNGELIDRNTPRLVGTDSDWSIVSAGAIHSFAIKTDTTLWAWGDNTNGRLGLGDIGMWSVIPVQIGANSEIPDGPTGWVRVYGGLAHSIAIKNTGTIWTWGSNSNGQLGIGDTIDRNIPTLVGE